MRILILSISIISLTLITAKAQQSNLDSLYALWQDETKADTVRLDALYQFNWNGILFTNPDSAYKLAQIQFEFAEIKGLKNRMADALIIKGITYAAKGDYPTSEILFNQSYDLYKETKNLKGIALATNSLANCYRAAGNYLKAIKFYQTSIVYCEKIDDVLGVGKALVNLGLVYLGLNEYEKSETYSLKAIDKVKNLKANNDVLVRAYNTLAFIRAANNKHQEALDYYNLILESYRKSSGNEVYIVEAVMSVAKIYSQMGQYAKANEKFDSCFQMMISTGYTNGIIGYSLGKGDLHYKQGEYDKAIKFCAEGYLESKKYNQLPNQMSTCECLYLAYKASNDDSKALEYYELFINYRDSIENDELSNEIQQIEFNKQLFADSVATAEKDRLIKEAHEEEINEKNKLRNWTMVGAAFALLLAGGFYTRYRFVNKSKAIIEKEKHIAETERARSDDLLLNILPAEVAEELKNTGASEAQHFDEVSILFTDFKGFTQLSEQLSAKDLVNEINTCFKAFDNICDKYGIEKIKTIGDSYMCAAGLKGQSSKNKVQSAKDAANLVLAALEMQHFMTTLNFKPGALNFAMRAGIHTGPVVAGIVGIKKFQYDIWGDTVNTASRMESHGQVGKVNISAATYDLLKEEEGFSFEAREELESKGKGLMKAFFVELKNLL